MFSVYEWRAWSSERYLPGPRPTGLICDEAKAQRFVPTLQRDTSPQFPITIAMPSSQPTPTSHNQVVGFFPTTN